MFVKFPHIDNLFLHTEPSDLELQQTWIATEKIDGCNFQINVDKDKNVHIGKRTEFITPDTKFYNLYSSVFNQLNPFIEYIKNTFDDEITFYGEYFGDKVMRRIDYKTDYSFRLFAARTSEKKWMDFFTFYSHVYKFGLNVPIVNIGTYEQITNIDVENLHTFFNPNEMAEGIVINPVNISSRSFIFKKKSQKFRETKAVKFEKEKAPSYKNLFDPYCTENRMITVFTKLGIPESKRDAGNYIKEFYADALEDFLKDYPDLTEQRDFYRQGSLPYTLFCNVWEKLK